LPVRGNADWTPQRLTWLGLMMSWDEGQTLGARWEHACQAAKEAHGHWRLGDSYSGFTQALLRQTPRIVTALKARFRRELQALPARFQTCWGWQAFSVDGSRQEAPHTRANEAGLGCAGRDKTAPQVFLTTILHLGTGLPWDFRVGPGTASERQHLREMIGALPADALLVADAGFVGYELCRELMESGRAFLWRVGGNVRLLKDLGYYERQRGDLVYLWPSKEQKKKHPPLVLRLIRLRRGKQTVYLVTNVLSGRELPNAVATRLYERRWGHEVFWRSFKQTLERRQLLSRTPATCLAESQWTLLGLWLLGLMTVTQVIHNGGDPRAWSVAQARDIVRAALRNERPRRCRRRLLNQLAVAVKDGYRRRCPKGARNYPRKKRPKPPGPPKIEPASVIEIQRAAQLEPIRCEQTWTA
jgi:Transposase DDE domain